MQGTVREVLSTDVVTIRPDAPLALAEQLLVERRTSELFVIDPCGRLLGLLPDYELLKLRLLGATGSHSVAEVMTAQFEAVAPEAPLAEVALRLRMHVHARVPVVDRGRLVGQVSRRDLLIALWLRQPPEPAHDRDAHPGPVLNRMQGAPKFLRRPSATPVTPGV
jgi:CBS domain-containing protein